MLDVTNLKDASDSWRIPPDDIDAVRQRARTLIRRRQLLTAGASMLFFLAIVAVSITWAPIGNDDDFKIRPAGDTVQGGQAATFAFHALLETTDYTDPELGPYDYKSVDQIESRRWTVHFQVGLNPEEISSILQSRRGILSEAPRLSQRTRDKLREDIQELEERLDEAEAAGGPFDFDVTVEGRGSEFHVAAVRGQVSDEIKSQLLSFSEPTNEVPAQGTEHWRVKARIRDSGMISLSASTFWTGPIPSQYRETCLLSLIDAGGETVFTQQESPNFRTQIGTAPETEDLRDWGFGMSGGPVPNRLVGRNDLEPVINCRPVEGDGWTAVGEAEIQPVKKKQFYMGSSAELTPEQHVFVSSRVVYEGEPGIESICIARVFDQEGEEISSHGLTILEEELRIVYGKVSPIKVPVNVGDPDEANYATMSCRPTVPGVNLGPDQED